MISELVELVRRIRSTLNQDISLISDEMLVRYPRELAHALQSKVREYDDVDRELKRLIDDVAQDMSPTKHFDRVVEVRRPMCTNDYGPHIPVVAFRPVDAPAFDGYPTRFQANQGIIHDCGVIATIGAVAEHRPEAIKNAIVSRGDGIYEVTLHSIERATKENPVAYPIGGTTIFRISDEVPYAGSGRRREPIGARGPTCAWPSLLEKALAAEDQAWTDEQLRDWGKKWASSKKEWVDSVRHDGDLSSSPSSPPLGYNRLDCGIPAWDHANLLAQLSGEPAEVRQMPTNGSTLLREFRDRLNNHKPIVVTADALHRLNTPPRGIYPHHAYQIVGLTRSGIQLHNPWGVVHPTPLQLETFVRLCTQRYATLT
ncbi:hypothetical protein [Nocardia jejuensis]|uniref:hypothetical protein n=1 Tax=Nocardia jejuensis TaxID=328049 RepID=UPI0012F8D2E2|nr:hypothetical protein [Nocardia jejuensis]